MADETLNIRITADTKNAEGALGGLRGALGGIGDILKTGVGVALGGFINEGIGALVGGWMGTVMGFGTLSGFDLRSLGIAIAGALVVLFLFGMARRAD